jgi:hypothetical protein
MSFSLAASKSYCFNGRRIPCTLIPTHPNLDHFEAFLNLDPATNHMSSRMTINRLLWGTTVSLTCSNIQPEVTKVYAKRII